MPAQSGPEQGALSEILAPQPGLALLALPDTLKLQAAATRKRNEAVAKNRPLQCAIGQLPTHRQVIATAAFFHQCLHVVALACLQVDRPRLLGAVPVPLARGCPCDWKMFNVIF